MASRLEILKEEAAKLTRLKYCTASAYAGPDSRYLEVRLSYRNPDTRTTYHVVQAFRATDPSNRFAQEVCLIPSLEEMMLRAIQEGKDRA